MARTTLRHIGVLVGLAAAYFAAGKLGLALAFVHPSASAVWPPSGIALSALLILGYEMWPAVLIGAFLVNATTMGSPLTSTADETLYVAKAAFQGRWSGGAYPRGLHVWGGPCVC